MKRRAFVKLLAGVTGIFSAPSSFTLIEIGGAESSFSPHGYKGEFHWRHATLPSGECQFFRATFPTEIPQSALPDPQC